MPASGLGEGVAVAQAKGRLRGKQPKLSPPQEAHLIEIYRAGEHTIGTVYLEADREGQHTRLRRFMGIVGLVLIFSEGRPKSHPIRIDKVVELGRVAGDGVIVLDDDRVSRRHTRIALRERGVAPANVDDGAMCRVRPASVLLPEGDSWISATEKARQSDAGVPIAWVPFAQ